jgi:hypothetical protein
MNPDLELDDLNGLAEMDGNDFTEVCTAKVVLHLLARLRAAEVLCDCADMVTQCMDMRDALALRASRTAFTTAQKAWREAGGGSPTVPG